jgi:hypothetical protein
MADVYGVNSTKYRAGTVAEKGGYSSQVLSITESYTATSLADGSTINIGKPLPANAKVLLIVVKSPAFATGRTLAIGDKASSTRYAAATSVASATTISAVGGNYVVGTATNDDQITLTNAGICNSTTPIQVTVFYTL